ncbi:YcnI family protein [Agreia sp.]|uniref:YcnI family copper-binding membrane protein n=1 Tax=Agreia sp. TaxID=1872416 RepID=UPI0035BC4C71
MKKSTPLTVATTGLGLGLLLAVAVPLSASAHVSVTPAATAAGSYTVLTFAVPHGCDGSATTSIAIDIPESILSVTPTINPNWDVAKVMTPLATPATNAHGEATTERVGQVVYTAKTALADGYRDTFALSLQLPADAAGTNLDFPVLQSCETGSTNWNEIPAEGADEDSVEHPAPSIAVTDAVETEGHGNPAGAVDTASSDASGSDASGSASGSSDDVLARVLGIGGLVVGAVGVVIAVVATRRARSV